jgi:hypothetical protein
MGDLLLWPAAIAITFTAIGLLLIRNWRYSLVLLAAQYIAMFLLVQAHWPTNMAAVKLVTGWMCAAALGITQLGLGVETEQERSWPEGSLFRLLAALLIVATLASIFPRMDAWLPDIGQPVVWGAIVLIGLGLLHLGITLQPLRAIIGLLTLLSGFEILYAAVENSILVAALISAINLGLALTGAYLMNLQHEREKTE